MPRSISICADTLTVPGAELYYEVRGSGPVVALVGCPMDATFFAPLAHLLATDHTVVTTDPQGINRSKAAAPDQDVTPQMLADGLSRILVHLDAGPAVVVGSSGGAVTALALTQAHPEQVSTVVAHEPPLEELLDDRVARRAATENMVALYLSGDVGGAWALFLGEANIELADGDSGPVLPGDPSPQAVADERFFFAHTLRPSTLWVPDLDTLRAVPARIVVGIGADSTGQVCDRTSTALAAALGVEPTIFPGGHIGFVEDPAAFATRLRAVLT